MPTQFEKHNKTWFLNRKIFSFLFIFLFLKGNVLFATGLLYKLPAPCDTALANLQLPTGDTLGAQLQSCTAPFGHCASQCTTTPCPGNADDDPGVLNDIQDFVVKTVVEVRLNNLYQGFNGLYPSGAVLNGTTISPATSQFWNVGAVSQGPCAAAGACNLFCGEGPVPGPTGSIGAWPSVLPAVSLPTSARDGGQGFQKGTSNLIYTDQSMATMSASGCASMNNCAGANYANPGAASNNNNVDIPFPNASMTARGVISPLSPTYAALSTTASPSPSMAPTLGWPTHVFNGDSSASVNACAATNSGEGDITDIGSGQGGQMDYNIKTLAWDDGTFALPGGTGSCDLFYISDYSAATTMTALQTGALVQANWMALDEVLTEIATGQLSVYHTACNTIATATMAQIRTVANTLTSVGACGMTLASIKASCSVNSQGSALQSNCYLAATMALLGSSSFGQAAVCEVFARADDIITGLFLAPNSDTYGAEYMKQLKNWAVSGCILANAHNVLQDSIDQSNAGNNCNSSNSNYDWYQCNTDPNVELSFLEGNYASALNNCFPYAYTAALRSYLMKNPADSRHPFKNTATQGYGSSPLSAGPGCSGGGYCSKRVVLSNGNFVPTIQIRNCQIIDTPAPSPSPSPSPSVSPQANNQSEFGPDWNGFYTAQNESRGMQLPCFLLGLLFPARRSRSRAERKRASEKKSTKHLYSCFLLGVIGLGVGFFEFGLGCGYSETDINLYAFVQNYCVGQNGILLTGNLQPNYCCSYDSNAGTTGSATNSFSGEGQVNGKVGNLHAVTLTTQPTTASVYCPGVLDDVLADVAASVASTNTSITNLSGPGGQIMSLSSSASGAYANTAITPASGAASSGGGSDPYSSGSSGYTSAAALQQGVAAATAGGTGNLGTSTPQQGTLGNASGLLSSLASTLGFTSGAAKSGGSGGGTAPIIAGSGGGEGGSGGGTGAAASAGGPTVAGNSPEGTQPQVGYSGGGGGGGLGGGGGGRPTNEMDGSSIDWGLGKAGSKDGKGVGKGVPTAAGTTIDPPDYFNRIKASDNLFKLIEQKYREKTPTVS